MIPKLISRKIHSLFADKKFAEILSGSAGALSARVVATSLGLVLSVMVVRLYGAEMMGVLAVLQSFLGLATIFTVLGTKTSILRLIPEHIVKYSPTSAFRLYRKTQYLVIGVSLITGAIFFFSADFIAGTIFSNADLQLYFVLASLFIVFNSIMLLNTQAVRGLRLIKLFALMQVLPTAANLLALAALSVLFYTKSNPVYAMLSSLLVTGVFGWFVMEYQFRKKMAPGDVVYSMSLKEILTISLPMLMTATMSFVIGQTGVIMLGMFRSEAEVGYFAIAVKLATLTAFVLAAINSMAGPKFSELYHLGKIDELFYVARKSAKLVFWTTTPILFFFIVFGRQLLGYLYGGDFAVAYPALTMLVVGQFINSIAGSTGMFMNMTGNEKKLRNMILGSAIINIGLNFFLVPRLGINGSAIAAMVSLSFWNIAALFFIKSKYGHTTGYFPKIF
jgi:O-antigen/teichoic acid export membrane protein